MGIIIVLKITLTVRDALISYPNYIKSLFLGYLLKSLTLIKELSRIQPTSYTHSPITIHL